MITVNERWIIQVEGYNYIVCKNAPKLTTNKDGKERTEYPTRGYFHTFSQALQFISDEEVRISLSDGDKTLPEAVTTVRRVRDEMHRKIDEMLKEDSCQQ